MYERIRRSCPVDLDPHIFHAALIYGDAPRAFLKSISREYLDIGRRHNLPMIATTPTWRANAERIARSSCAGHPVNADAAAFTLELQQEYSDIGVKVEGCIGPKGDGYLPGEAPDMEAATRFHTPQIEALASAGVDSIVAKTLPALEEARGMAKAFSDTGIRYSLSFVIRGDGSILDGTPLADAVAQIDDETEHPPTCYQVNCVHASVYRAALIGLAATAPEAAVRITGLDANTSAKSPEELEGLEELDTEAPEDFGEQVWALHGETGATYLGGCCGSSTAHIEALARHATAA